MIKRKFCEDAKISSGFRVVIPVTIRKLIGLRVGDELSICVQGNRIIIEKNKKEEKK